MAKGSLSPIHSTKHFVQTAVVNLASGSRTNVDIVSAVAQGSTLSTTAQVWEGEVVKAVYVEYWVSGDTASKTVNAIVLKLPSGVGVPSFTEMNNLQTYDNKKNILVTHQGLAPSSGNIIPIFREWIAIPKGKQRMGLGDKITMVIAATGTIVNFCGINIFKSYT